MENKKKPLMLDISQSSSEPNEGLISFESQKSPDIEDQLEALQYEIQGMNDKLLMNERHLEEKKLENEELKQLLSALQEKYTTRSSTSKTGCCNNINCILL